MYVKKVFRFEYIQSFENIPNKFQNLKPINTKQLTVTWNTKARCSTWKGIWEKGKGERKKFRCVR